MLALSLFGIIDWRPKKPLRVNVGAFLWVFWFMVHGSRNFQFSIINYQLNGSRLLGADELEGHVFVQLA